MTIVHHALRRSLAAGLSLGMVAACSRSESPKVDATDSTVAVKLHAPTPPVVGRDLRALQWIEGTWRGSGDQQAAFYERYRLADDSTLVVETFGDSTVTTVTETTRFRLREGKLTSAPGASGEPAPAAPRWFASSLSPDSVRFEPLIAVHNVFVWRRGNTPDEWTAVLNWASSPTRPRRQATYTMRRWR